MNLWTIAAATAAALLLAPIGASAHSGGLNAAGCHAGSKPYHCHNGASSQSTRSPAARSAPAARSTQATAGRVSSWPRTVTGPARIMDGDTLQVGQYKVRLNGVDAPEMRTRAGRTAKVFMDRNFGGREVACVLSGKRTYDRYEGTCSTGSGDLGATIIANGYALDCQRYSGGRYARFETPAAKSRLPRAGYC